MYYKANLYSIIIILTLIFTFGQLNAQEKKTSSIQSIHKLSGKLLESFEDEGYEILRVEEDLIFSKKKTSLRTLHKGVTYVIVAYGDKRVKDIDLSISVFNTTTKTFEEIDSDKKENRIAILKVTPTETTSYSFSTKVYAFEDSFDGAHYGLMIMRK